LRVPIEDEVAVGAVLVLADLGVEEGSLGQLGEALRQEAPRPRDPFLARRAVAGGGVEVGAPSVVGELEASAANVRNPIEDPLSEVDPHGQGSRGVPRRAGRWTEVVDLL